MTTTLLNQPLVDAPLAGASEPAWLTERRADARETYEHLPLPNGKDERWRFSSMRRLQSLDFDSSPSIPESRFSDFIERSDLVQTRAGVTVFVNDSLARFEPVSADLIAQGVRYLTVEQAIRECPDLIEPYFLKLRTELGSAKFHALHAERVRAGSILYVPKNVVIREPVVNYHWMSGENAVSFPHTLVIAEANSEVSLVDVYFSDEADQAGVACAVADIYAGPGAKVFRKIVQDWNEKSESFQLDTTVADRDAEVKSVSVNIGGDVARFENQVRIEGSGAHVKLYALTISEGEQEFDQRTFQIHNAPNSVSDLLYKNALVDNSRTIFSGLIKVAEGAQQTDAYQTNRNLLLDPTADANSMPGLEILANDVKCSHGATTGNVDPAELFYLQSRGIPRRTAMQLMVFGFFEEIIEKIDSDELSEALRGLIRKKFQPRLEAR